MHTIIPIFKDVSFTILLPKESEKLSKIITTNGGTISNQGGFNVIITTLEYLKKTQDQVVFDILKPMIFSTSGFKFHMISERGIHELSQIKYRIESSDLLHVVKGSEIITKKQVESLRDWNQLEKFEFLEQRRIKRHMSVKMLPFEFESIGIFDMEIWELISSFLSIPVLIKSFSLVSKDLYSIAYLPNAWKERCEYIVKQYKWFPSQDLDLVNVSKYHWFKFYRKSIYPLILDTKYIKGTSKLTLFMDMKRNTRLPKGISKFGGHPDLPIGDKSPPGYIFVAQINLSDLKHSNTFSSIPFYSSDGMLYFFVSNDLLQGKMIHHSGTIDDLQPYEDEFLEIFEQSEIQFFESFLPPPSDNIPNPNVITLQNNQYCFQFLVKPESGSFDEIYKFQTKDLKSNSTKFTIQTNYMF